MIDRKAYILLSFIFAVVAMYIAIVNGMVIQSGSGDAGNWLAFVIGTLAMLANVSMGMVRLIND